jgi:hypothetical protein
MEEGRKRVLGIIAGILVARHLKTTEDLNGGNLPKECASLIVLKTAEVTAPAVVLALPKPHKPRRRATAGSRQLALEENESIKLSVECYAGRKADERPVRFWLEEKQYQVEAVLDQWYDPESIFFKVRADDGNLYILRQQTSTADWTWELDSFRQTEKER